VIETLKEKTKWVRSREFLAILTLFVLSLLFFGDLLYNQLFLGERSFFTERDLAPYFIAPRFFWVESIKHGSFPLWNPYQFSGQPFLANPQHGVLYPLNILFFLFPFDIAFNAIIMLHFFLGGLFTYLLVKDYKVNSTSALISGLTFMLSGYLLSVHSLLTILLSSIWTPLIMMFFRRAILRPGFRNEVFTAIFVIFSFLGGGIEIVYGNFFVLLIMVIFSPYANPPSPPFTKGGLGGLRKCFIKLSNWNLRWLRVRSLLIISFLFLFLSAIQLFPFIELFYHSIRGSGMSYQEATTWSFAPKDILLFFLPDAYGYFLDMKKYWVTQCWFKTLYTGGLPFILSLIFFLTPLHRTSSSEKNDRMEGGSNYKTLFLLLMLFSIFISLGRYNPLYPIVFKYIPFFNGIRYPAKFLYIFILLLSVTAGMGFQRLINLSNENGNKSIKDLLTFSSFICGLILLFLVLGHKEIEPWLESRGLDYPEFNVLSVNIYNAKRLFFYLTLFFLLIRVGYEKRWTGWAKALLTLFLVADLFGNMGYYGKEKVADYFRKTKILEIITSDKDFFRVFSTAKTISQNSTVLIGDSTNINLLKEKHIPSMNLLFRLHDIWGIDVIRDKRINDLYMIFTGAPSISTTHLIDLYGVKYIASITPLNEDDKFKLIYANLEGLDGKREDLLKENTIKLYKNRNPLSRAWLVKEFKVMDSQTILWTMLQKEFRPAQEVFLEEEPEWTNLLSPPFAKGKWRGLNAPLSGLPQKVQMMLETNNKLDLQVNARENSLLVLSDTYYPGWKAFVDGKETKLYRADYTFRAIPLNAGTHQVEFVYDPISFKLGAGVTILGILGCVGIGWTIRQKNLSRSGAS
jgi:hypothetical protein